MRNHAQAVAICWTDHHLRLKQFGLFAVAMVAWWLVLAVGQSWGQAGSYKTLPLNPEFIVPEDSPEPRDRREEAARRQRYNERNRLVNDIFKGDAGLDDNLAAFDQWFNEVIFAQMAQDTDEFLGVIAENREQVFKQVNNAANAQAVAHLVNDLALPRLQEITTDNYHPSCRLNAVVMLGRLDQRVGASRRTAPEPLSAALPLLLQYVQDGALPEYVRVGALWGIERHCRIDGQKQNGQIAAALRGQIVSAMLPMLGPKPDDRTEAVDYWMKRMAVRSLGGLRELGNNDEVASTLMTVMEQADAPMLLRCEAARAYGGLRFGADAAKAQPAKVAGVIAKLAAVAAQGELDYLDNEEKHIKDITEYKSGISGGGSGMGSGGGYFGPMGGGGGESPGAGVGGADPSNPMGGGGGTPGTPGAGGGSMPGGAGGFGGFGGFGQSQVAASDLPVYRFRVSQRRLLTYVYFLQQALETGTAVSPGLSQYAGTTKELADLQKALANLMENAQVGLVDKDEFDLDESLGDYRDDVQKSITTLTQLSGAEADGADPFGDDDAAAADASAADAGGAGIGAAGN